MKLTQKVDHFTVFKSFPSTSCCSPPNNLSKLERKFSWILIRSKQKMIRKGKMSRLKRKSKTTCSKKVSNQKNSIMMKMPIMNKERKSR